MSISNIKFLRTKLMQITVCSECVYARVHTLYVCTCVAGKHGLFPHYETTPDIGIGLFFFTIIIIQLQSGRASCRERV